MDDVAGREARDVGVGEQRQLLEARELGEQRDDAVAAVVAAGEGDAARVEEDEQRVEGREAGAVG